MAEFLSALPASLSAIPNRDIGQAPALRWHASPPAAGGLDSGV